MSIIKLNIDNPGELDKVIIKCEESLNVLKSTQLKRIANFIIQKLQLIARQKKWKTIPGAIEETIISENEILIHPSDEKEQLFRWLHSGTKRHFVKPTKAKALSWVQDGERRLSKGHFVSGIIATNFFRVTPDMASEIKRLIESFKGLFKN